MLGLTKKSVSLSSKDFAFSLFKDFQPEMKSNLTSLERTQAQMLCLLYGKVETTLTTYLPTSAEGFEVASPARGLRFTVKPGAWGLDVTPIGIK